MRRLRLIVLIAILSGITYLLGWSNTFAVSKVVITESDKRIARELSAKIKEPPAVISIGEPIARVDRRAVQNRLRSLIWVDKVSIKRNFLSGDIEINVTPRSAIAQLDSRWSANPADLGFLGEDLQFFFVPKEAVEKAARSGDADWRSLPKLALGADDQFLKEDVATILALLGELKAEPVQIEAGSRENLKSQVVIDGRSLDISWGSVEELELKERVLGRLLELKANRKVRKIDISSPLSPIVR